jgi:hypothetical protein
MLELIITHPANLERVYGESGSGHIFRAIKNLCEALGVDGIDAEVIRLDEPTPADWRLSSERFLDLIDEDAPG